MTPEARARQTIDALLTAAGWHVCDVASANLHAGSGAVKGVAKGFEARGSDTAQGFVVFAGAGASLTGNVDRLRKDLLSSGVLTGDGNVLKFTQDYVFSSPSTAAAVVLGRSANGRIEWKDAQGLTLKELQEAEAGS